MNQEVENVRVVARLKPMTQEELDSGVQNIAQWDGQVLTITQPMEDMEVQFPTTPKLHTPKSNKRGPPKTPKIKSSSMSSIEFDRSETTNVLDSALSSTLPSTPSKSMYPTAKERIQKTFAFDKVYSPITPQQEVFEDVAPYVEAAVEGYNATVFCYGQTGSGKTHTMMGPSTEPGIIPRAIRRIFEIIESKQDSLFVVQLSFVELHLDKFYDLLDPNNAPNKRNKKLPFEKLANIEIHEDVRKQVYLTGSDTLRNTVTTMHQALEFVNRGCQARTTALTNLNVNSSRSHSILTIHIESRNNVHENSPVHCGKLHLVDLAGSERLAKSGAEGETLRETRDINSSLSALGDVLAALSSKSYNGPIPYRNSKLTRLLQDSLGGNSKTFFVINIQTTAPSFHETLMSLSYGQRAKKIKNITSLNRDLTNESDLQHLTFEVEALRKRLHDRTKEFEKLKEQRANTFQENQLLKEKLAVLAKVNSQEIEELEHQLSDVVHSQNTKMSEISYQYFSLQTGLNEYRSQIQQLKLEIIREQDEKEDIANRYQEVKAQVQQLREERDEALNALDKLRSQSQELETNKEELRLRIQQMESRMEDRDSHTKLTKSAQTQLEEQVAKYKAEVASLNKEIAALKQEATKQQQKYTTTIQKLEESNKELSKQIDHLEREAKATKSSIQADSTQLQNLQTINDRLKRQLTDSHKQVEDLESQLSKAQDDLESQKQRTKELEDEQKALKKKAATSFTEDSEASKPKKKIVAKKKKDDVMDKEDKPHEPVEEELNLKAPKITKTTTSKTSKKAEPEEEPEKSKKKRTLEKAQSFAIEDDVEIPFEPKATSKTKQASKSIASPPVAKVDKEKDNGQKKRKLFNAEKNDTSFAVDGSVMEDSRIAKDDKKKGIQSIFRTGSFMIPKLIKKNVANKENDEELPLSTKRVRNI